MISSPPVPLRDLELVLEQTAPSWEEMRGQSLFITGGTGFFGCWLLETFCHINRALELGAQATVLTRDPSAFRQKCPHLAADPAVTLLAGDIRTFLFPDGVFRYTVHAATDTSAAPTAAAQLDLLSSIANGTERALQFAATHGTEKFLLTSSGAVYGPQPTHISHLPETYSGGPDPLATTSAYAEGKRASELLCALYGQIYGFHCKVARCWAFCGPHLPLHQHFAIGSFIGDVLAGRPIQIKGDGTPMRSFLYAADLAVWLWTILFEAPPSTPFNVGSDNDISILQLAQTVAATLNPETAITLGKAIDPNAAPSRYVPSVARARKVLGLHERIGLEETIRRTASWHRSAAQPTPQ